VLFVPETGLNIQRVAGALVTLAVYFDFSEALLESLSCRLPRVAEAETGLQPLRKCLPFGKRLIDVGHQVSTRDGCPMVASHVATSP